MHACGIRREIKPQGVLSLAVAYSSAHAKSVHNFSYPTFRVVDRIYTSGRVEATLRYRFKTPDRKPRPRSQSYVGMNYNKQTYYIYDYELCCR